MVPVIEDVIGKTWVLARAVSDNLAKPPPTSPLSANGTFFTCCWGEDVVLDPSFMKSKVEPSLHLLALFQS